MSIAIHPNSAQGISFSQNEIETTEDSSLEAKARIDSLDAAIKGVETARENVKNRANFESQCNIDSGLVIEENEQKRINEKMAEMEQNAKVLIKLLTDTRDQNILKYEQLLERKQNQQSSTQIVEEKKKSKRSSRKNKKGGSQSSEQSSLTVSPTESSKVIKEIGES